MVVGVAKPSFCLGLERELVGFTLAETALMGGAVDLERGVAIFAGEDRELLADRGRPRNWYY